MVAALSRAWRVNEKISSMFLFMVWTGFNAGCCRPARSGLASFHRDRQQHRPLPRGDWLQRNRNRPEARRRFLRALSERLDLKRVRPDVRRDNPRLVQQAMYLFMSVTNRRAIKGTACTAARAHARPARPPSRGCAPPIHLRGTAVAGWPSSLERLAQPRRRPVQLVLAGHRHGRARGAAATASSAGAIEP